MRLDITTTGGIRSGPQGNNEVWGTRARRGPPRNWDMTTPHCWSRGSRIHRDGHSDSLGVFFVGTCLEAPSAVFYPGGGQRRAGRVKGPHKARAGNWAILGKRRREWDEMDTYLGRQADIHPGSEGAVSRVHGGRVGSVGLYIKRRLALSRHESTEMGGSGYVDCSFKECGGTTAEACRREAGWSTPGCGCVRGGVRGVCGWLVRSRTCASVVQLGRVGDWRPRERVTGSNEKRGNSDHEGLTEE